MQLRKGLHLAILLAAVAGATGCGTKAVTNPHAASKAAPSPPGDDDDNPGANTNPVSPTGSGSGSSSDISTQPDVGKALNPQTFSAADFHRINLDFQATSGAVGLAGVDKNGLTYLTKWDTAYVTSSNSHTTKSSLVTIAKDGTRHDFAGPVVVGQVLDGPGVSGLNPAGKLAVAIVGTSPETTHLELFDGTKWAQSDGKKLSHTVAAINDETGNEDVLPVAIGWGADGKLRFLTRVVREYGRLTNGFVHVSRAEGGMRSYVMGEDGKWGAEEKIFEVLAEAPGADRVNFNLCTATQVLYAQADHSINGLLSFCNSHYTNNLGTSIEAPTARVVYVALDKGAWSAPVSIDLPTLAAELPAVTCSPQPDLDAFLAAQMITTDLPGNQMSDSRIAFTVAMRRPGGACGGSTIDRADKTISFIFDAKAKKITRLNPSFAFAAVVQPDVSKQVAGVAATVGENSAGKTTLTVTTKKIEVTAAGTWADGGTAAVDLGTQSGKPTLDPPVARVTERYDLTVFYQKSGPDNLVLRVAGPDAAIGAERDFASLDDSCGIDLQKIAVATNALGASAILVPMVLNSDNYQSRYALFTNSK